MSFLQPMLLAALPLVALPIIIHLINQRRYQTVRWAAMMFLLAANRMSRGYARLRQWLIMAFRMAVIAALVFAVSRPLAGGWLGLAAGNRADTTIIVLDRSPSMQQTGAGGGGSKLETGRRQLVRMLETLGSEPLGPDRELDQPAPRARVARGPLHLSQRRADQRLVRSSRHASGRARLHPGQQVGADGDLDLLRPSRERLERRERPLAVAARRLPGVLAGRSLSPAGVPQRTRRENLAVRVTGVRRQPTAEGAELLVSLSLTREGAAETRAIDPRAFRDRRGAVRADDRDGRAEVRAEGPPDPARAEPRARVGQGLDPGRRKPGRQRRLVRLRRAGAAAGDHRGRRSAGGAAAAACRGDLSRSGGQVLGRGRRGRQAGGRRVGEGRRSCSGKPPCPMPRRPSWWRRSSTAAAR